MNTTRKILEGLKKGEISIEQAESKLRDLSLTEVGEIGRVDLNREERSGIPEIIYAESKSGDNLVHITQKIVQEKHATLLTRVTEKQYTLLRKELSAYTIIDAGEQDHHTLIVHDSNWDEPKKEGKVAIVTAGTSDIVFAEEAVAVSRIMGVEPMIFYDIGVAGIHRLIEPVRKMLEEKVDAIVVFAGMEGALPTVLAALVDIPVIGVPVPVGYGHGGAGETALASMLQSCAPGLAVVNIGNGLGAGAIACLIAKNAAKKSKE
jgi:NCAIR mutase (PurE)-related protein